MLGIELVSAAQVRWQSKHIELLQAPASRGSTNTQQDHSTGLHAHRKSINEDILMGY